MGFHLLKREFYNPPGQNFYLGETAFLIGKLDIFSRGVVGALFWETTGRNPKIPNDPVEL